MKIKILTQILRVVSILVGLIPMVAWGQGNNNNNDTSTRSKLRIAIPVRQFNEFVDVKYNPVTGENNYSGFAIEVFNEVVNTALPIPLDFEFVPYQKSDGSMNGTFDTMLQAVFNKDYDAAVGEISILYYRTEWVDFTMPYIEASITMLVPIIKEQPSTKTAAAGFSLIGITYACLIAAFIIGFLAFIVSAIYAFIIFCYRRNQNMPRDTTFGSLIQTRLLITALFLILLTPIACYIISQTSFNISKSRSASIKDLSQLMRQGSNVGYREGSFIHNLLLIKGFPESKLVSLKSEAEMADMLFKGTSNGGVDAIVADAPQVKLLQAKNCDNFTLVPIPGLHATGFGFAFGKDHSDVLADVSKGILKLIDGGRLVKIQDKTIGNLEACPIDPNNNFDVASSFISPKYEWILIAGGLLIGLLLLLSLVFLF